MKIIHFCAREGARWPSSEALLHPWPPAPRGPPAPQMPLVPDLQLPALLPSSRSILLASPCLHLGGWASRQIKGKEPAAKEPAAQRATQLGRARQSQNPCRQGMISCTVTERSGWAGQQHTLFVCYLLVTAARSSYLLLRKKKKGRVLRKKIKSCW